MPEVVVHGKTGCLVEPRNAEAIAEAVERLIEEPETRGMLGRAGRRAYLDRFTPETMVVNTIDVYRQLAEQSASRMCGTVSNSGHQD